MAVPVVAGLMTVPADMPVTVGYTAAVVAVTQPAEQLPVLALAETQYLNG